MSRNIAKPFYITASIIDIQTISPKYRCFFGEDVELFITVLDEYKKPLDLSDVYVKVFYINSTDEFRQDDGIIITDPLDGKLRVMVKKGYIQTGNNTVRVILFDNDQEIYLQPFQIQCLDVGIKDVGHIIVDDDLNARDEFVKVRGDISIIKNDLDETMKDVGDLKDSVVDVKSSLETKLNKDGIVSMANMGQDVKEAMTGGSVAVVGRDTILTDNIVDGQVTFNKTNFMNFEIGANKLKTQSAINDGSKNWFEVYLEKGKTYKLTHANGGHSGCAIDIYKLDKTTKLLNLVNWGVFNGNNGITFSTETFENSGWFYLRFYVSTQAEANTTKYLTGFQIQEGTTSLPYEDYKEILKFNNNVEVSNNIKAKGVSKDKTDFIMVQNVSFTFKDGYTIDELTGTEAPSTTRKGDTSYKEVSANCVYYLNFKCRIIFYDSNKTYLSWIDKTSDTTSNFVAIPSNAQYIRINVLKDFENIESVFILSDKVVKYSDAIKQVLKPTLLLKNGTKSIFEGKKLVTDGDSITAQGLWQTYLINELGVIMHKNCGVGGTTVTSMCSDERVAQIPTDTELLIIMGGTNDFAQNIELGNINSTHDNTTFYGAYQLWLDKLYSKIPNSTIIIMIPPYRATENTLNTKNLIFEDYRKAVREVAYKYGYHYIDLRKEMKVNYLNYVTYIPDGVHPHMYGAKNMADVIIGDIKNIYTCGYTLKYN